MPDFILFGLVGFLGQLVDGALGMAYGVVSSTVLLSAGVTPAAASASVHSAELFTTAASGASHLWHRNVDWRLFWRLAPTGILGAVAGAYLLTGIDGHAIRPFIVAYLGIMGIVILYRAFRRLPEGRARPRLASVLGGAGGFLDAVGGGGWGPVVTGSLIGSGAGARHVIGTVNAVEFLVTLAASMTFLVALLTGRWEETGGLLDHGAAIGGLIVGGLIAAPIAGYATRVAPKRVLTAVVGTLVVGLAIYQGLTL